MSIVNIKFNCIGIKLLKLGRFQVELWMCPPSAHIPLHCHPNVDSIIIHIFGRAKFEKISNITNKLKFIFIPWFDGFKAYKIPHNTYHGAEINNNNWMWFINIENWKNKTSITSTSKDIQHYV